MLGKLVNGKLITAHGKVLKVTKEEVVQIPVIEVNEETGEETTTYREETHEREYIVANPREEDWREAGYKDVIDGEHLQPKEGYYESPVYTDDGEVIRTIYEYKEIIEDDSL